MSTRFRSALGGPVALAVFVTLLVTGSALGLAGSVAASPSSPPAPVTPVTGSITGPTVLAYNTTEFYTINGTGGPAISPTGEMIGNITYFLALSATNLTGVSMSPTTGPLTNVSAAFSSLTVRNVSETVAIHLMISSTYLGQNQSINLTYQVLIVHPYMLTASLVADPTYTVLSFQLEIYLDGYYAGVYTVPSLTPGEVYTINWAYASAPLSSGWHTFTFELPTSDKGLVTFANGQSTYTYSFYITGPAPDYSVWITLAIVAFVAVAFISLIFLGGRRRNRGRS